MIRRLFGILVLMFLLSLGCASNIGRQVQGDFSAGSLLKDEGYHRIEKEHLVLEYNYSIDRKANTLTCDGFIRYKDTIHRGFKITGLHIDAVFLDSKNIIIATEGFFLTDQSSWELTPFKRVFNYDVRYSYVAYGYGFSY